MIGASMMHRALSQSPTGKRVTALTMEAVELWFATERAPRRLAWIQAQLGEAADQAWRALGLAVARAEIFRADDRMQWQQMTDGDRLGEPVLVAPVWQTSDGHWAGAEVVDMLAIDPAHPERVASRTGACEALGEIEVEAALFAGEPIVWHRDAMSWLRAGGNGRWMLGMNAPARFAPLDDQARVVERVLLAASEIQVEDDELGHALLSRARALRKRLTPKMPDVVVADAA
jgi:hypothetical protein